MINWRNLLAAVALALSGCGGSQAPDQSHLKTIAAGAGITLPPAAILLYEDTSLLSKAAQWIVSAEERFILPGDKEPTSSDGIRLEMDMHLKPDAIGDLSDPLAIVQTWQNAGLRFRGSVIRSSNGYFLRLEQFAQP